VAKYGYFLIGRGGQKKVFRVRGAGSQLTKKMKNKKKQKMVFENTQLGGGGGVR